MSKRCTNCGRYPFCINIKEPNKENFCDMWVKRNLIKEQNNEFSKKNNCTEKERRTCRVEKMGCKGCYYDNRTIYIHYGSKHFNKNLFQEIKNVFFIKPEGGLWASRINNKNSWINWVEENQYCLDKYNENNCFKFKLKENARILTLKNIEDLKELQKKATITSTNYKCLDFEKISKDYDALEVFIENLYLELYGWDCNSILIFNKDIVEEV